MLLWTINRCEHGYLTAWHLTSWKTSQRSLCRSTDQGCSSIMLSAIFYFLVGTGILALSFVDSPNARLIPISFMIIGRGQQERQLDGTAIPNPAQVFIPLISVRWEAIATRLEAIAVPCSSPFHLVFLGPTQTPPSISDRFGLRTLSGIGAYNAESLRPCLGDTGRPATESESGGSQTSHFAKLFLGFSGAWHGEKLTDVPKECSRWTAFCRV